MTQPRRYPLLGDPTWLAAQRAAGRTAVDIAAELGCSDRAVGKALRAAGVTPRKRGGEPGVGRDVTCKPGTRHLARAAARARLGTTADNHKAPPLRPQPPDPTQVLVVRVDRGWTSTVDRAVLLVQPHHTLHDLALTVVDLLACDPDDTHLGAWLLPPDGRLRRPYTDGYHAHLSRCDTLYYSIDGCHPETDDGWSGLVNLGASIDAPSVAGTLGVGAAAWLIWDLGALERFSVRVLAGVDPVTVEGLDHAGVQTIYHPCFSDRDLEHRYGTPMIPPRWAYGIGPAEL